MANENSTITVLRHRYNIERRPDQTPADVVREILANHRDAFIKWVKSNSTLRASLSLDAGVREVFKNDPVLNGMLVDPRPASDEMDAADAVGLVTPPLPKEGDAGQRLIITPEIARQIAAAEKRYGGQPQGENPPVRPAATVPDQASSTVPPSPGSQASGKGMYVAAGVSAVLAVGAVAAGLWSMRTAPSDQPASATKKATNTGEEKEPSPPNVPGR